MQCTSCGTPLSTGMINCPTCNRPVPYDSHPDEIPQRLQIFSAVNIMLLTLIVLFLIAGGGGLAYYAQDIHPNEMNAQATTVAQTVLQAQERSTAQADLQLSATAAALTPQQIYTQATSGTPVINDPLTSFKGNTWYQFGTPTDGCYYSNGAYHIKLNRKDSLYCYAFNSFFHDLAFQVEATIVKGDIAGLLFQTSTNGGYIFVVGQAGGYGLYLIKTDTTQALISGTSMAINTGLGQSNLLTVIVRSGKIYMFVNKQPVAHLSDSTYSSGQIALYGEGVNNSTDVAFNNAQVWSL
jgi:hypothetical protein